MQIMESTQVEGPTSRDIEIANAIAPLVDENLESLNNRFYEIVFNRHPELVQEHGKTKVKAMYDGVAKQLGTIIKSFSWPYMRDEVLESIGENVVTVYKMDERSVNLYGRTMVDAFDDVFQGRVDSEVRGLFLSAMQKIQKELLRGVKKRALI